MKIRFVSNNTLKIDEVKEIFAESEIEIIPVSLKIEEIQTDDVYRLVKDKVLKAFNKIGRPVFVEHTGLYVNELNGFPAGLTQIFWDKLEADKFSTIIGNLKDSSLVARTIIGYCDGKKVSHFEGSVEGSVPKVPSGDKGFQWDCVFIPKGYDKTFAELGRDKNDISMRRKALDRFKNYLEGK